MSVLISVSLPLQTPYFYCCLYQKKTKTFGLVRRSDFEMKVWKNINGTELWTTKSIIPLRNLIAHMAIAKRFELLGLRCFEFTINIHMLFFHMSPLDYPRSL